MAISIPRETQEGKAARSAGRAVPRVSLSASTAPAAFSLGFAIALVPYHALIRLLSNT
jgi:hypothetical protein